MKGKKITTDNYFETIEEIGFENLPQVLQESHQVILLKTDEGDDWSKYKSDAELKRMVNLAFKKLEEFMVSKDKELSGLDGKERYNDDVRMELVSLKTNTVQKEDNLALNAAMDYVAIWIIGKLKKSLLLDFTYPFDYSPVEADIHHSTLRIFAIEGKKVNKAFDIKELYTYFEKNFKAQTYKFTFVKDAWRYIPEKLRTANSKPFELDFIYRFIYFNNKTVLRKEIHDYFDELEKAIKEKKIRKTSSLADEIMEIQKLLIPIYNKKTKENTVKIVFRKETEERFRKAIGYSNPKQLIKIPDYAGEKRKAIPLAGIVTNETKPAEEVKIMPSVDFANLQFNSIGFTGKWLTFIGDPAPGFTAMVFGMPKMGKSYLCVDFAGYLARNHGKVLYVAKEEKLDATLQQKLKDKQVAHENLFVADALPSDLSAYDFIFLDSVNKIGLTPKDLDKLKADNKGKSFIYVFQATKGGKFKGNNEFQHDVDVVIEVPEQGKAVQFGRFNQGGEINIFSDSADSLASKENVSMLAGVNKKNMKKNTPAENKTKGKDLLNEVQIKIERLSEIVDIISEEKNPNWGTIGSLANLHESIGTYIIEGYSDHTGYSKSIPEGMKRHTTALRMLIKKLEKKVNDMYKNGWFSELTHSKNTIEEWISSYPTLKKKKPYTGKDYSDELHSLKDMHEENIGRKFTDDEFNEIFSIAINRNKRLPEIAIELEHNIMGYLMTMDEATDEWDRMHE